MMQFVSWLIYYLIFVTFPSNCTIDINLSEYRYIADRLTLEECRLLVTALHFQTFDLPKSLCSAVKLLPKDASCIDLLLHWNSKINEGKGRTHVEVCHRLNQIGREDLAQWLSKTVFNQLSKQINIMPDSMVTEPTAHRNSNSSEIYEDEEIVDEAPWFEIDSILSILTVFGIACIILGTFFLCCLCCFRRIKASKDDMNYEDDCSLRDSFDD